MTEWQKLKNFINSKEINSIVLYKELQEILTRPVGISYLLGYMVNVGILKKVGLNNYRVIYHMPERFTSGVLMYLNEKPPTWDDWFMTLEDRMKKYSKENS